MPANVLLSCEATSAFVALPLHSPGVELKAAIKPLWIFVVSEGSMGNGRCHLTPPVNQKKISKKVGRVLGATGCSEGLLNYRVTSMPHI